MSSARNHAKRSHRSEAYKTALLSASAHRGFNRSRARAKKLSFFGKMMQLFRRKTEA